MVQSHKDSHEEGMTTPFTPQETEKICHMGPQIIKKFYNCTIESILIGCITACYGNCSTSDCKALQRVVRTAQYITGAKLPAIQDLYTRCASGKPKKLSKTPVTQVIDCSLCYRTASSTGVPSLGPKGSLKTS